MSTRNFEVNGVSHALEKNIAVREIIGLLSELAGSTVGDLFLLSGTDYYPLADDANVGHLDKWTILYFVDGDLLAWSDTHQMDDSKSSSFLGSPYSQFPYGVITRRTVHIHFEPPDNSTNLISVASTVNVMEWILWLREENHWTGGWLLCGDEIIMTGTFGQLPMKTLSFKYACKPGRLFLLLILLHGFSCLKHRCLCSCCKGQYCEW